MPKSKASQKGERNDGNQAKWKKPNRMQLGDFCHRLWLVKSDVGSGSAAKVILFITDCADITQFQNCKFLFF